ncbi:MAG: phosphatase PAP2 family protein [Phenylobacterium sp.]
MDWKPGLAAALAVTMIGAAPPAPKPAGAYLGEAGPDTYRILPPAPVAGTTRYEADRAIYLGTRSLKDTPRWVMAQGDVSQPGILKDLACAVGVELTRENAPKTAALLARMAPDVSRATNLPKDIYKRQRPYLIDEGPTCIEKSAALSASPDYPSGHNTWGWSVGLVLAELAPDRATEVLVRARAFGEGRLVCGVHNLSAVEAGRMNASIVVAALHGSEAFRTDMDAARKEVAAARKAGPAPDPAACAKEAEITAKSPY